MAQGNKSSSFQLIYGNSTLNDAGLETFGKEVKLAECRIPYAAISIMGPQSSGKSTLLNHLFGTTFREMDTENTRGQTTQGIWLAAFREMDVKRCTLVMDLEGSDGSERGGDDTKFEKQAALFAFAISDIVLINLWCHDVGREHAASKPLLRTVFRALMKLKLHDSKTTLWFVLRDKTKTPMNILEEKLRKDIQQISDSVAKGTPLRETFSVKFKGLPHYDHEKEQFREEVANLKRQLLEDLAGNGRVKHPCSGFSFSVKELWKKIEDDKDLDLPSHEIMVATVQCEKIADSTFDSFSKNKALRQLQSDVQYAPVKGFGNRVRVILDEHLLGYATETEHFDVVVGIEKRRQLKDKMIRHVEEARQTLLEHICSRTLDDFKDECPKEFGGPKLFRVAVQDCTKRFMTQFDEQCRDAAIDQGNWGSSKLSASLLRGINTHVAKVESHAISKYLKRDKERLKELLSQKVEKLFRYGDGTWKEIGELFRSEIKSSISTFSNDIDEQTKDKNLKELEDYARQVIHEKSREAANKVQTRMEERFARFFSHDDSNNMRVWTGKEDIPGIAKTALIASLEILSTMAAVRLDDDDYDIKRTLFSALIDNNERDKYSLDSGTWEKVPVKQTLIKPIQCKEHWEKFNESSKEVVINAEINRNKAKGFDWSVIAKWLAAAGLYVVDLIKRLLQQ